MAQVLIRHLRLGTIIDEPANASITLVGSARGGVEMKKERS